MIYILNFRDINTEKAFGPSFSSGFLNEETFYWHNIHLNLTTLL